MHHHHHNDHPLRNIVHNSVSQQKRGLLLDRQSGGGQKISKKPAHNAPIVVQLKERQAALNQITEVTLLKKDR